MEANYAVIDNNIVINVILYNGTDLLTLPTGWTIVLIPDGSPAWTGWGYTATGGFTPPAGQ
jgi:hypothetical protein